MIDILFSDSACGSLKIAQHYGKEKYPVGCMSIIVSHTDGSKPSKDEIETARKEAEEKKRMAWDNATPLDGKVSDIYGFNLLLSIGDISENQLGIKRKQVLEHLFSVYPNDQEHQVAKEIFNLAIEDLKTIRERAATGETFRVWYSNQPDDMCGLYWFMSQFNQWNVNNGQVVIVKLPEWESDGYGNVMQKNSWAEVAPEEWYQYFAFQKTVSPVFIQCCASHWQALQAENAPLRAVLNGQLVSVSEKLYDDFIRCEIEAEDEKFHEAMIVGRVLGKYQLGICDSWVALRIEEMIRDRKLETVTGSDKDMPLYHRVLKKVTH
ncbi:DUF1835 domain-containing protein [Acetobacterium malicum]|uniref:DUF1835 domain-containing protein n=1 Tax=Acetobacterium malicum TaxID=52692 RepID=A0ABR6Z022_9FIRM|nr:DUF3658 domain-containing protein [Acetobacterium malicum]MBC3900704.1 DUF1835 domain-containing protein [Acetobacterium malicum]